MKTPEKSLYLAIDKCLHGTVALSINDDIGGTRLTGGCCGYWITQRKFHLTQDSLATVIQQLSGYLKKPETP